MQPRTSARTRQPARQPDRPTSTRRASARGRGAAPTTDAPANGPTPQLARGRVLFDRYRLEREIGRGGVADVWRADDLRLDRPVAIKILHPHLLPDETWRRRFVAEARAASGLTHPGIVPVYDVIDDPATPAIVFQLVDGESLATRLARRDALPLDEATRIAARIAGALDHAHRAGVVHRDVKPANIVIDDEGRARLVDFGIARVIEDAGAELTGRHEVVGTLRYMAPEQLEGKPSDARTDLYALGLVIAEMVPDLEAAPEWLRDLVGRLRAPDPANRPESAGDVARALETGRLEPDAPASTDDEAVIGSEPVPVDPDAVTRTFGVVDAPSAAAAAAAPAAAVAVAPTPAELEASPMATPAVAPRTPAPAVDRTGPTRRRQTDNRPVVVAILATGLILGGFAVSRSDLFASFGAGSSAPAPTIVAQPTPTNAPVTPATPASKPHKSHGHGPHG